MNHRQDFALEGVHILRTVLKNPEDELEMVEIQLEVQSTELYRIGIQISMDLNPPVGDLHDPLIFLILTTSMQFVEKLRQSRGIGDCHSYQFKCLGKKCQLAN